MAKTRSIVTGSVARRTAIDEVAPIHPRHPSLAPSARPETPPDHETPISPSRQYREKAEGDPVIKSEQVEGNVCKLVGAMTAVGALRVVRSSVSKSSVGAEKPREFGPAGWAVVGRRFAIGRGVLCARQRRDGLG